MTLRLLVILSLLPMLAATARSADLVLTNGRVVTVDEDFSIHEALAVREGRILAVGSDQEVSRHIEAGTRVIDLQKQTVIPGLIDNHVHIVRGSRQWPRDVRLDGVHSRAEARRLIAWFAFRENDLGSLEVGKLADFLVLDRDYLGIPAD